jgi:ATP-binding cassette subfamily F protein uup
MRIVRGDKIAFVGPNGVGKSTLLKLLLGQLQPTAGKIKLGTQLQIGYFDQLRAGINPEFSALENVGAGREFITINGKDKHVISYLSDFLFTPQRIRTPVKMLSGGECNRLLLAKLFSLPTNLLVLDEPTNDLDIESLELLENILVEYPGTVLLVSHDRTFVDNVVSSTLYFRGEGKIDEFVGGYRDIPKNILAEATSIAKIMNAPVKEAAKSSESSKSKAEISVPKVSATTKALSSKMQKELDELPNKIRNLEAEIEKLQSEMADLSFYQQEDALVKRTLANFDKNQKNLELLYQRWEELENMQKGNY